MSVECQVIVGDLLPQTVLQIINQAHILGWQISHGMLLYRAAAAQAYVQAWPPGGMAICCAAAGHYYAIQTAQA